MLRQLDELFWVLRREGFAISPGQAVDAVRAVDLVGFSDKAALRAALLAVIGARGPAERRRFEAVFDRFFSPDSAHAGDLWGRLRERGFSASELDALRELLEAAAARSGPGDAAGFLAFAGAGGELDHLLLAAGIARSLAPMTSSLQVGYFAHRVMDHLRLPRVSAAIHRLKDALREALGDERGAALADALKQEIEAMKRRVRDHVEATLARRVQGPGEGGSDEEKRSLLDAPFTSLSNEELDEVRRAVRALGERLRGGERVRRRRALRGRIDPHKTLRKSLRTGGVPFQPARQIRRRDRPRLLILCDISDSVRHASRFMLEFVCIAQELFARTRSFVFVSELAETTDLFDEGPPEAALARIMRGEIVSAAHNSNYGRALLRFEEEHAASIDRRTTVVILGDGRTNYLPDEAEVVGRLAKRARALLWLCPESPGSWGTGDSAMLRYAPMTTKVLVTRTARELEMAAREVVARR